MDKKSIRNGVTNLLEALNVDLRLVTYINEQSGLT